jgi:aspartyl-tRNA(Asn)/glutamyl-tRNA(Gln) amidotransferase subunit A
MKNGITIAEAGRSLRNKEFSSVELTQYYLDRIEQLKSLNAYITVDSETSLDHAKRADELIAAGNGSPLAGIPIAVKDLFCTKGIRTTAGSKMLSDFVPGYESTVSRKLLEGGAVFLGKTNMDEFAMGSANITSYFGPCYLQYRRKSNPELKLVPGGSSGGSATAVASDLCVASIGSDTGGSIRQPASFSGIVGIKPTYGLCSRYGMIAFASSLDQAGPLTRTVEDAAIVLRSIAGHDELDSTSADVEIPDYTKSIDLSIKGMKIGIVKEYMDGINEDGARLIESAKGWLVEAGCEIVDLSLETTPYALPAYYIIAPAEASSNLSRYDGVRYGYRSDSSETLEDLYVNTRTEGFGDEVKRRILTGTYVLSAGYYDAYYMKALKVQKMIRDDFRDNGFAHVDLILTLTTLGDAFAANETETMSPIEMYLSDVFTVNVNITGLPAISVPAGLSSNGLPLGVQLIGDRFQECKLFSAAHVIEKCANFCELKKDILQ